MLRVASSSNGWRRVTFGEMAENIGDRVDNPSEAGVDRYVGLEHLDPESLKIRRWGTPEQVEATKLRFKPGDIIFGKRRAYQRKLAVADFEGICSAHAMVLRAREETVVKDFLAVFMQSEIFFERALSISVGSLSPTINWKTLSAQEFMVPPKEEQRRIAEILWAAEKQRTSVGNAATAAEQVAQALVYEHFHATAGMRMLKLEELSAIAYGLTVDGKRRAISSEYSYLRVANVGRGFLDLSEVKTIGCMLDGVSRFQLHRDDVLVVEGHADINAIGRAAIWSDEIPVCLHQNHILRARSDDALNPRYLVALLNSNEGCSYFRSHAKSTSGLHTINSTVLREFPVPYIPRRQQDSFIERLKGVQERVAGLRQHLNRCEALGTSLREDLIERV